MRRLRGQPQQAAKLFQRLAEVHEKLGKLDEAYRQLVEADRMGPGQLLTKLSLGENRFRAGRWREAAMHLGSLADHPDAALYPEEVAEALAHAAQAEIKLRHPERAIELYESALKLRGGHRPTLRALADLALERGEKQKAASYLRRIAEESCDRQERAQVYERLGDLYSRPKTPAGAGRLRRGAARQGPYNGRAEERSPCSKRCSSCSGPPATPKAAAGPPRCSSTSSRIRRSAASAGAKRRC